MNPAELISAQFGGFLIPLERIAQPLLGVTPETANRYAQAGELDFPVFRLRQSEKAPWFTTADALAEHVDNTLRP